MKKFSIVQLFSVVDGRLSTKMDDVYEILNFVLDEKLATHELPAAIDFIESLTPKPNWYVVVLDAIKEAKNSVGDDFEKLIRVLSLKNEYVDIEELPIDNLIQFRRHAVETNPLRQRGEGNKQKTTKYGLSIIFGPYLDNMGNKVPHFFFSENKLEAPGAGFITSTQSQVIGKVIKFDDARRFHQFMLGNYKNQVVEVHGYTIVIEHYYGSVNDGSDEDQKTQIGDELIAMANFYYEHTIKPKLSYYKRYLLHPNEEV